MFGLFLLIYVSSSATCSEQLSRHRRSWIIDTFSIEEGQTRPFPYVLGKIDIERNDEIYFELHGEGVDEEPVGVLSIEKKSGLMSVHRAVDYEERTSLMLKVQIRKADLTIDTNLGVEISIRDINDNPPRFQLDLYEINVNEESPQGSNLLTVLAHDPDQRGTPNSTFHYEIKSVSPNLPDTKFFIDESGMISFKGCLDYEVAEMFTLLVEAKDHGEVVSLSSSTTVVIHVQDGNNHRPSIIGRTGTGKVKEYETGSSPLRLHVSDRDSRNSPAWRAKYTIQGDEGKHFKIETDPDTNDGILAVVKALDFEEGAQRELSISVENEVPYFPCKVKERAISGLWKVDNAKGDTDGGGPHSIKVIIEVEDTNDPPEFNIAVKEAFLVENTPTGTWIDKVTAVDPDASHARDIVYSVGHDPAGWVTVDPHTGNITTVKTPDRESPHVVNGVYTILVHAVDNGKPPLTSTATVNILVIDQNDNVPQPMLDYMDVCVSDGPGTINITAFDLDENPFGGPFAFKLLGEDEGKWALNPSHGYTAGLVKEAGVYAGKHTVHLKIFDLQGKFGVYNLSVTVCDCSVTPNCRMHRDTVIMSAFSATGIMFASLILLLFLLLMAVRTSCKEKFNALPICDSYSETILTSNIEKPGTDCKLPEGVLTVSTVKKQREASNWQDLHDGLQPSQFLINDTEDKFNYKHKDYQMENMPPLFNRNTQQMTWNSQIASGSNLNLQVQKWGTMNCNKMNFSSELDSALLFLLNRRLSSLETEDLEDHQPHLYADEGEPDNLSELEEIILPDHSFMNMVSDLGPKFNKLASICKPPHLQN